MYLFYLIFTFFFLNCCNFKLGRKNTKNEILEINKFNNLSNLKCLNATSKNNFLCKSITLNDEIWDKWAMKLKKKDILKQFTLSPNQKYLSLPK